MIVIRNNYGKVIKQYKTHLRYSSGILKFAKNVFKTICTLITENSIHILFNFLYKQRPKSITVSTEYLMKISSNTKTNQKRV